MTTEPKPRITLLYIGCREGERDKPLHHLWHDVTGISNDGSPLKDDLERQQFYGSKKKGHSTKNLTIASPGAIYSFERSENGVYGSTGQYLGRWACEEDVLKWTAEHNAIDRAAELAEVPKRKTRNISIGKLWSRFDRRTTDGSTTDNSKCCSPKCCNSSRNTKGTTNEQAMVRC